MAGFKSQQLATLNPQQLNLLNSLIGGVQQGGGANKGLGYLSGLAGGDESSFQEMEAPYQRAFQGALGQIGSRYAGMGALGSSAFQNATSGAAQSFAENLGAQRHSIRQNALESLLGHSETLLGYHPFENVIQQKQKTSFGSALGSILPSILGLLL